MILLSSSASIRKAFHIAPIASTPAVPTSDWYRHWRVDARKNRELGEVMLFTNHETLYTLTADSREFRKASDVIMYFLFRYGELFGSHFGYNGRIKEDIIVHAGIDLSVAGVMNGIFQRINSISGRYGHPELEELVNGAPIVSRGISALESFTKKLNEKGA